jgi:type I restriction enzyme S subunit
MTMPEKQLPSGWEWKRLGDICEEAKVIVDGRSSDLPFLGLEMVESETGKIDWDAQTVEGTSSCFYFDERHILYGKLRPYLNKVALPDIQGRCSTELVPLFPKDENCREFIAYLLRRKETVDYAMAEKTGSRMPRVNVNYLLQMKVVVPTPDEQRRIAAIIDAQLMVVEKARQAAAEQMKVADDLVQIYLREIFSHNTESNTPLVEIGKLCEDNITNLSHTASGYIDYIDISSIDNISKRITETQTLLASEAPSRAKQILKANDILVSNVRPNLNAVAINDISSNNTVVGSTGYCILRCKSDLNYKYLFYFCQSKDFIDRLSNLAKGSNYPAVTNDDVLTGKIPLLSIEDQNYFVSKLENRIQNIEKLNAAFSEQNDYINALPTVILRQAFNGEL